MPSQFAEELSVADNIFHYKHPVAEALRNYEKILADGSKDTNALSAALAKLDELGAWDFEAKVHQILNKLNINNLDQKVKSLSGGQRKRVALAQVRIDIGFEHKHVLLIWMNPPTTWM